MNAETLRVCNEVLADKIDEQAAELARLRAELAFTRAELAFTRGERDTGAVVAAREIARVLRERNGWRAAWHKMAACLGLEPSDDPIAAITDRVQVLILENDALKRGAK